MGKGALITLPAGIYHRFTLAYGKEDAGIDAADAAGEGKGFVAATRLFEGEPVWTPYNRGEDTDKMDARVGYVTKYLPGDAAASATSSGAPKRDAEDGIESESKKAKPTGEEA